MKLRPTGRELFVRALFFYILKRLRPRIVDKVKATLEQKTMREVIFESLNQFITSVELTAISDKKRERVESFRGTYHLRRILSPVAFGDLKYPATQH